MSSLLSLAVVTSAVAFGLFVFSVSAFGLYSLITSLGFWPIAIFLLALFVLRTF